MQHSSETASIVRLPGAWREPVERLAARVRDCFGADALGLVVHGAALDLLDPSIRLRSALVLESARHGGVGLGNNRPNESRLGGVWLGDSQLEGLRLLATEGPKFGRLGLAAPVVLTRHAIERSRDTFPLELLEIQWRRILVLGDDFFASLTFEREHVRLACERELKVLRMAMHGGLLTSGGTDERLGELNQDLGLSLARVLHGLAWLTNTPRPATMFALVDAIEKELGIELRGVTGALDRADTAHWSKFRRLHADLEALEQFADAL